MLDTIRIHQSFILPTSKGVKATPLDVDGYAGCAPARSQYVTSTTKRFGED